MKARVEIGCWVFRAPVGCRYISASSGGGKVLNPVRYWHLWFAMPMKGMQCDDRAWSKGKYRHYAYYRCQTRSFENKGASTPVAKIEQGFANIPRGMQPAKGLFDLAKAMLRDAWNMRLAMALNEKDALEKQLADVNRQLENMPDHIVEANSTSVVSAYETRLEKIERNKIGSERQNSEISPSKGADGGLY